MLNQEFVLVAEDLKHNSRGNNRTQLAAVNNAIKKLVLQQEVLLSKFSLREED